MIGLMNESFDWREQMAGWRGSTLVPSADTSHAQHSPPLGQLVSQMTSRGLHVGAGKILPPK